MAIIADIIMKLSKDKKGVELTFNTVVIIVLVLLVLIILAFLLIRTFNSSTTATGCTENGARCETKATGGGCPSGYYYRPWGGCKTGEICCSSSPV